jgi:hypothetical protein
MRTGTWWRLLVRNRFRIAPTRIPMAIALSVATPFNDLLTLLQRVRHGRKIQEHALSQPPVFIVGHWRSGTTLLHELLMLDPRHSYPDTYQCFAPNHFLVSEWVFQWFFNWLLPPKRPMDNVAAGWDRPQEDEFALMNLGLPSPYLRMAFPRNPPPFVEYLDFAAVDEPKIRDWLKTLELFLKAVSVARPGRLVLKSPTHTGRIGVLADYFPGAKFLHITRNPRDLFPSTLRLWKSLDSIQGLHYPHQHGDRDYVLRCLERMYASFHLARTTLPANSIVDIRYEDLVADPVTILKNAYAELDLGDFQPLEKPLQDWVDSQHRGYQPNAHRLPDEDLALIRQHWQDYFTRYGYQ